MNLEPERRSRLSPPERRRQLLAAITRLAADQDLDRVPTARVAAAAGVSQGLLFHYFPTRQALRLAVVETAAEALIDALRAVPQTTPAEQLLGALHTYIEHVEANPHSWRTLLHGSEDPEVAAVLARVETVSLELLLEAFGTDPPNAPAAMTMALHGWLAFEKETCARWLAGRGAGAQTEENFIPRTTLVAILAGSLLGTMRAVADADPDSAAVLSSLLPT